MPHSLKTSLIGCVNIFNQSKCLKLTYIKITLKIIYKR